MTEGHSNMDLLLFVQRLFGVIWGFIPQVHVVVLMINAVKKTWEDFQGLKRFILTTVGLSRRPRFHIMVLGNDMNCHKDILSHLGISYENNVISVDQSDVVTVFVPIVSRAGTDIQAALQKIPKNRPVVFIVLHHTFDPNYIVPDSSQKIRRSNVFPVDLLFHEDQGMLNCPRNTEALEETKTHLQNIPQVHVVVWMINTVKKTWEDFQGLTRFILATVGLSRRPRFYIMLLGNDMNCHKDILSHLGISYENNVISVDQSDIVMVFVPIVSRAGTDIQAALQKIPKNRPVVFIVLHHTFDPNYIVPDSSQEIRRSNVFPVDLLFHEDHGMLNCPCNTKALEKTKTHLQNILVNYNYKGL